MKGASADEGKRLMCEGGRDSSVRIEVGTFLIYILRTEQLFYTLLSAFCSVIIQ